MRNIYLIIFWYLNVFYHKCLFESYWNTYRIRLIRPESNEMNDDFLNELYRWALECKYNCLLLFLKYPSRIFLDDFF